jgi:hypothetical protein
MSDRDPLDIDHLIDIACGSATPREEEHEQRGLRRIEHDASVAFVQRTPSGGKSISTIVTCRELSVGGMSIISRYMLHVGYDGAILVHRPNGEPVVIGIKVAHCTYLGEMAHESGLEFTGVPEDFTLEDFRDEHGNMPDLAQRRAA